MVLLGGGLLAQGVPQIGWQGWAIITWLAVVNTALAFTLWNQSQRVLSAMESSIINNTMLAQISLLAWLFLGEEISRREVVALVIAGVGTFLSQWRHNARLGG